MIFRSERGQSTAMVITMLWVLVFFVAVVANVGQAVNRRIALQMVADAGAYTGGSVLATGMNHLAYWNRQIQRMWRWVSFVSLGFNIGECSSSWSTIGAYYGAQGAFVSTQLNFAQQLQSRPRNVSSFNLLDLFPGEDPNTFDFANGDTDADAGLFNVYGTGQTPWLVITGPVDDGTSPESGTPLWSNETPYDYVPDAPFSLNDSSIGVDTWTCYEPPAEVSEVVFVHPVPWWKLERLGQAYYFIWRVKAPATKAIMFDSIIGPNAIPEMKAVAVTKPVGDGDRKGEIARGDIGYRVKLVPASKAMLGGWIRDELYKGPGGLRQVTH
jgi:hypothetical protein